MKLFKQLKLKIQKSKKGYCDEDVWGFYYWFLDIVPKMLKELRETNYGVPCNDFPEVDTFPKEWLEHEIKNLEKHKETLNIAKEDKTVDLLNSSVSEPNPDRWWMILSRIIWCLEQASDKNEIENIYEKDYFKTKFNDSNDDDETSLYELMTREVDKSLEEAYIEKEKEIFTYKENCKNEALDLIKKYFYDLWD